MADFGTVLDNQGWIAAAGLLLAWVWRSVSLGRRFGGMEATQAAQGKQLDYIAQRLDTHIDRGRRPNGQG